MVESGLRCRHRTEMAAKSMNWMFVGVFCTLIPMHGILLVGLLILQDGRLTVNAQIRDAAARFLDQKELEVKWIAGNATLNDGDCGSLASCRAECSRATCLPLTGESRQCVSVHRMGFRNVCPSEDVGCQNKMLVDYSKSYVTLPAGASTTNLQTEVAREVCLQRRLDSTFKTVSFPSNFSKVYFGSTSGVFRSFPGREENGTQCTSYDPRWRSWYLKGISMSSLDVKILVDVAKSMNQLLSVDYKRPGPGVTYLDVAKNMTLTLLQTFSPGDNVEVFPFDATDSTSLGGALAVIGPYNHFNPDPELAALVTNVSALGASSDAGASDLNGAIRRAAGSFNQVQSLKVIIVLSNGLFVVNSTTFPSAALQKNRAKLMVYKLPTIDDGGDTFLRNTPFQKDICSVQGSFELLDALATLNPLYSMRSYFTYLAGIQLSATGGNVTWASLLRTSYSQDNLYFAIPTYPAFGRDGLLIGVAGLDFVLEELEVPLQALILEELLRRSRGTLPALANISMTCYYQTSYISSTNRSCPPPDSSAICPRNDFTSTLAERTCCETCLAPYVAKFIGSLGIVFGTAAIIGLSTIIIIAVIVRYRKKIFPKYLLRQSQRPVEVDLFDLNLCERIVNIIDSEQKSMRNLLNEQQCLDLSSKLSTTIQNIREIIFYCGASANLFKPALEKLYLDLEKAKLLVLQCGKADWCRAAVFQIHNEIAFQEILLDVGLCYNAIYEQARSLAHDERSFPEDLRQSNVFTPTPEDDVHVDQVALRKRLEDQAHELKGSGRVSAKQCLARYLLERLKHSSHGNTSDTCCPILWTKDNVPTGVCGNSKSLEVVSGVCFTKWMGMRCAKKVFPSDYPEQSFLEEASISAQMKHPCVVDFMCCGNGELRGDRFIAMEVMERNLFELIEPRSEHFSLRVVVDIMVQIARGMCYLHAQGIAHRDLKPQNVVVTTRASPHLEDHFCVKLVDFGTSKTNVEVLEDDLISIKGVGTTLYRAPEVHPDAYPDGVGWANWFKADAFSFAMTCAHMLSLRKPFKGTKLKDLYPNLMAGKRHELPEGCPQELKSLLEDCWTTDPSLRPPFVQICTRLEALRFKILRGYPIYVSNPQGECDEFIKMKIDDFNMAGIRKSMDASNGVAIGNEAVNALESKVEEIMIIPSLSQRDTTSHASVEMTQCSQILRRFSF